jgi:hypothetical protein
MPGASLVARPRKVLIQLEDCPRTKVFRAIDTIARTNAILQSVIPPAGFKSWTGSEDDNAPLNVAVLAAMRLSPIGARDDLATPDSLYQWMKINVDMQVNTRCSDDIENLWHAFKLCFYPPNDPTAPQPAAARLAVQALLVAAGAYSGLVKFDGPTIKPGSDEESADGGKRFYARGMLSIEVIQPLNP